MITPEPNKKEIKKMVWKKCFEALIDDSVMSRFLSVLGAQLVNKVLQGCQLSAINQAEFLHKEDEMLEGSVKMGLFLQLHDRIKVLVVNMGIDSEQALENGLCH